MRKAGVIVLLCLLHPCATGLAEPLILPSARDIYPVVPHWPDARILHIGDSHLSFGFKMGLSERFSAAGARFRQVSWKGSRTKSWVASGRAAQLIDEFRPTVVVVTIGTNEMGDPDPARNASWVKALVKRIGSRMCYWLGPPPLLDDVNGYNDFMADHVAPCRYFDSRSLSFHKRKDGRFHLSGQQGDAWAASVWRWMNGR